MDLSRMLGRVVELHSDADAVEDRGSWATWGQVADLMTSLDRALDDAGVPHDAAIGLVPRGRASVVAAMLGLLCSGRCVEIISHIQADSGLADDVARLGLAAVVALDRDWERPGTEDAASMAGTARLVLPDRLPGPMEVRGRMSEARADAPRRHERDVAIVMLTSGTTGRPKRVPLTAEGLARAIRHAASSTSSTDLARPRLRTGVVIVAVPLVHVSGFFNTLSAVAAGRRLALLERFSVDDWVDLVERHQPVAAGLPPTAIQMVLDAGVEPSRLSSLRVLRAGTAPLSPELSAAFEQRYRIPIITVYGATEFAGAVPIGWTLALHERWIDIKRGSAGRAFPGTKIRVTHQESREPLPVDTPGTLELQADAITHLADATGWVRTTDIARIDGDGFVWFEGRNDDVIIRGGFKVDLSHVEAALEEHPDVEQVAVVGLEDTRLGFVPGAAVVLRPGATTDADGLLGWCRNVLTPYQVPVTIVCVDELPRTPSMKIRRPAVRDLIVSEVNPRVNTQCRRP